MADYSDEDFKKGQEQKRLIHEKLRANNNSVEFVVDPPGALEPVDDRRRRGMQRMAFRSKRHPNVDSFVRIPMMHKDAMWSGATPDDFTKATFINRMDWELNAPRFLVQPAPAGQTKLEGEFISPLGMIDFWYDKAMYGKVNLNQTPIYLSEAFLMSCSDADDSMLAPSFVAQAWRHFEKDWSRFWTRHTTSGNTQKALLVDAGVFRPNEQGNIPLKKAWVSVHPLYNEHMAEMFQKFQQWLFIEHRNRKILNFKQFVQSLLYWLDTHAPDCFLTRSAFILSRKCPRAVSGFQLELTDEDPNDDVLKKQTWLNDPNFEIWVAKLRQYGFSVDFNIPWRVVADVNSTPMRNYIRDYAVEGRDPFGVHKKIPTLRAKAKEMRDIGTERALELAEKYDRAAVSAQTKNLDVMFKTCYYRADLTDLQMLMSYILSWWNDFSNAFPIQRVTTYAMNEKGPANQTLTIEYMREKIVYDANANPSVKNLRDPYSILAGKSIYRASGQRTEQVTTAGMSPWDVWVTTFGSAFPAQFYLFVRAREAGIGWSQKRFDKYVKILRELQKSLDGKAAMDYINSKTRRLPTPGGNPMPRTVEHYSKAYNIYEDRERHRAGRGMFMLNIT